MYSLIDVCFAATVGDKVQEFLGKKSKILTPNNRKVAPKQSFYVLNSCSDFG